MFLRSDSPLNALRPFSGTPHCLESLAVSDGLASRAEQSYSRQMGNVLESLCPTIRFWPTQMDKPFLRDGFTGPTHSLIDSHDTRDDLILSPVFGSVTKTAKPSGAV